MAGSDPAALRAATAAAADVFCERPRRAAAATYLRRRGVDIDRLPERWVVGYAPPGWTRLAERLTTSFDPRTLVEAGLLCLTDRGQLVDVFRERLVVGIRDDNDAIVGFVARDTSGRPGVPRYLNTRRHAAFDKGAVLLGLREGRAGARPSQFVVVEGPLDAMAIASRQAGTAIRPLLHPVAPCGTAFTETHAHLLAAKATHAALPIVVAMDGDAVGQRAALAIGDKLHRAGAEVRVAALAQDADPAEHLLRGGALSVFTARGACTLLDAHLDHAIAAEPDRLQWVEGRVTALREVAAHLATYDPTEAARQLPKVAERLRVHVQTATNALEAAFDCPRHSRPPAAVSL